MFENIKAQDEFTDESSIEKKDTSEAPPAEKETTSDEKKPDSEVAKTPSETDDDKDERFDKHSRFQELRSQVNEYKQKYEELRPIAEEVEAMKQTVAKLTEQKASELPKFETMEDLNAYLAELPKKIKSELLLEMEAKQTAEVKARQELDQRVTSELQDLKDAGEEFDDKELLQFAVDYKLDNLETALKLYKQIHKAKEEGTKKGEEFAKRKSESGLKSTKLSDEPGFTLRKNESLDDIFSQARKEFN